MAGVKLNRACAHAAAKKIAPEVLLGARLFPDMLPMIKQVQIATDHAKGAVARLAGAEVPRYEDTSRRSTNCAPASRRPSPSSNPSHPNSSPAPKIGRSRCASAARTGHSRAGDYLLGFALPNFYFHLVTAYNILRHNGVEIGKADYLGNP
jgi:hypothetical protein